MSFQRGSSGLQGAGMHLEVVGNAGTVGTVGFKQGQGQVQFADAYANSMNRSGHSPVGSGKDGTLIGAYSNQRSRSMGQIVLINFANPNGLQALGHSLYQASAAAGAPIVGTPSTGTFGTLQSHAVEQSNVDPTAELVNMIVAQRVYQANSQTIRVQHTVLQPLVNLR